jgi:hypothetical protein
MMMDSNRLGNRTPKVLVIGFLGALLVALWVFCFYPGEQTKALWTTIGHANAPFLFVLCLGLFIGVLLVLSLFRLLNRTRLLAMERHRYQQENVRLRRRVELSEQRCRHFLDYAGDAIFLIDPGSGALREMNQRAEELLGYTAEETRTLSQSMRLFPGRQQRRYLRLMKKVLKYGYGEEGNLVFRRKDGQFFIGAVHARLGDLGKERVVHAVLRDVTEIKRIEKELRRKNQDLTLMNKIVHRAAGSRNLKETLYAILEEVIENLEADGGGIYLVRRDEETLNLLVHHGIEEEILKDLRRMPSGEGLAGRVAARGEPSSSNDLQQDRRLWSKAVRNADWHGFQAVPLCANEKTVGVLFVFNRSNRTFNRDEVNLLLAIGKQVGTTVEGAELFDAFQQQCRLTEASCQELEQSRRQLRETLAKTEEANRALERLERMKSNFLALASHELRTPLTYVLSGTELLATNLQARFSGEEQRILEAVFQGGKRLERIVQDLLEVARIESQSIYLAHEAVNLPAIMEEIGREFQPVLGKRRLSFKVAEFPHQIELFGDRHHLKRTFMRLLENAVKFTPEGGRIEIRANLRSFSDIRQHESLLRPFSPSFFSSLTAGRFLQITMSDSGVGIDPEDHIWVFDKFYETGEIAGHFSSQTRFGGKGVGLGLTLVKGMVESHGGMVWVESSGTGKSGEGSAFHVLLPLSPRDGEAVDAAG